jgi:hypothetical protein
MTSKISLVLHNMIFLVFDVIKFIYSEKAKKFLRILHQLFVLCTASQIIGGDFSKNFGLLRIYELYLLGLFLPPS